MPDTLAKRLASLLVLSKEALCDLWKQLFASTPPSQMRRDLMIPIVAYRMQEQALGSLSARARERLRHLGRALAKESDLPAARAPRLKPGTRLVREWQSKTHIIHVGKRGYEYNGSQYDSLSEIARLITGTHRSGPLFFGLRTKQASNSKEVL